MQDYKLLGEALLLGTGPYMTPVTPMAHALFGLWHHYYRCHRALHVTRIRLGLAVRIRDHVPSPLFGLTDDTFGGTEQYAVTRDGSRSASSCRSATGEEAIAAPAPHKE